MAFTTIPSSLIQVGKATVQQIFQYVKDNFDDLDTRATSLEAAANKIIFYDGTIYNIGKYSTVSGLLFHRVQSAIDVTDAKVFVFDKTGISSGTIEIDVQKASSADFTSSVSIFTTRPSLDMSTASSYDESSNAVLSGANKVLSEGDYLRIDITSIPSGLGVVGFYLIGEPS